MGDRAKKQPNSFYMGSDLYDRAKWLAQIGLPAVATLYFALSGIWGIPGAEKVVGSITAVDLFLGALLGIASKNYAKSEARFDGDILVSTNEDGAKVMTLDLGKDPVQLSDQQVITFRVKDGPDILEEG
jgi:hypothetical protein